MTITAALLLGAFHGLNPAMGWLFAVARGLQERSRDLLLASLPAIAAGHLASVALVAVVVGVTGSLTTATALSVAGGVVLVAFGLWRLLSKRHFRWVGMRLSLPQLAAWSFLMSSAHGAGLMLVPVFAGLAAEQGGPAGGHAAHAVAGGLGVALWHTLGMFTAAGVVAVLVYEVAGLAVLRRAWFNVDRMWAAALVGAGIVTLLRA
ncbi:hypothetical protein HTZ77_10435 [Nonomuraea sp. SMC257]|uniref:Uncharacterized protein n=1 Tax=Nonomuraea montanisoli TaxID=2741721 RepID=A0A7Y6I5A4_9ACTN|nr:hypothetical protein [Nonomuraea montanisoli]NUW31841.1 hypothetical protein [Nonomuraea montanisoli]